MDRSKALSAAESILDIIQDPKWTHQERVKLLTAALVQMYRFGIDDAVAEMNQLLGMVPEEGTIQ